MLAALRLWGKFVEIYPAEVAGRTEGVLKGTAIFPPRMRLMLVPRMVWI